MNYWNKLKIPGKIYFGLTLLQSTLIIIFLALVLAGLMTFKMTSGLTIATFLVLAIMLLIQLVISYFIAMMIDFLYGISPVYGWIALVVMLIFGLGVPVYNFI